MYHSPSLEFLLLPSGCHSDPVTETHPLPPVPRLSALSCSWFLCLAFLSSCPSDVAPHAVPGGPASPPPMLHEGPSALSPCMQLHPCRSLVWILSGLNLHVGPLTWTSPACLASVLQGEFRTPVPLSRWPLSFLHVTPSAGGEAPWQALPPSLPLPIPGPSSPSAGGLGLSVDMANHSRLHSGLSCRDLVSLHLRPRLRVQFLTWCSRLSQVPVIDLKSQFGHEASCCKRLPVTAAPHVLLAQPEWSFWTPPAHPAAASPQS